MMTDYLFSVDDLPMTDKEIANPDYERDAEALKRVNITRSSQEYFDVNNLFKRVGKDICFCTLAFWRDKNWACFYKYYYPYPKDDQPFNGQRIEAHRHSNEGNHFFNMDTDKADTFPNIGEVKRCA